MNGIALKRCESMYALLGVKMEFKFWTLCLFMNDSNGQFKSQKMLNSKKKVFHIFIEM